MTWTIRTGGVATIARDFLTTLSQEFLLMNISKQSEWFIMLSQTIAVASTAWLGMDAPYQSKAKTSSTIKPIHRHYSTRWIPVNRSLWRGWTSWRKLMMQGVQFTAVWPAWIGEVSVRLSCKALKVIYRPSKILFPSSRYSRSFLLTLYSGMESKLQKYIEIS